MRIGVVGINYKLAGLKLREQLALACLHNFGISAKKNSAHHFVVLSTCNRTEIYFHSEDLAALHTHILSLLRENVQDEFDQKLYSYFGYDCLLHLCRVTAGLDSAIVAETEIQGQVKVAYEKTLQFSHLPEELHYLFQKSLRVGKQIRHQHPVQRGLPDLEHAILQTGQLFSPSDNDVSILFVGGSEINRKILTFLKSKQLHQITLCNRTEILAHTIAKEHNISVLNWQNLHNQWHHFDWIIFGTKSPKPLLTPASLPDSCQKRKLIIDLSVPRNVDADLAKDPRITLLNIDQLNHTLSFRKKQIQHLITNAEEIIKSAAEQHIDIFKQRQKQREQWLTAV